MSPEIITTSTDEHMEQLSIVQNQVVHITMDIERTVGSHQVHKVPGIPITTV